MQVAFALVRGHDVLQVRLCDKNMCDFCDVLFVYYIIIVYIWRCFDLFSIHYSCMHAKPKGSSLIYTSLEIP